jgi:hypothetical protein
MKKRRFPPSLFWSSVVVLVFFGMGICEFISGKPGDAWGFVGMAAVFGVAEAIRLSTKPSQVVVPPDLAAFLRECEAVPTAPASRPEGSLCDYD